MMARLINNTQPNIPRPILRRGGIGNGIVDGDKDCIETSFIPIASTGARFGRRRISIGCGGMIGQESGGELLRCFFGIDSFGREG